uniref:Apple domain-containing protein n=1 Tax=Biomphalaria glabrata TaxID=6526 RepID=A0A2C9LTU9_BIOGL
MALWTQLSPVQFQQISLTYDDINDVYMSVTALGKVPPIDLFTPVMTVGLNTSANFIQADVVEDCAAACVSAGSFTCNSFDYCGGSGCLLGQKHSESEGGPITTSKNNPCTHYTRTENGTMRTLDVASVYKILTDYVYNNMFQITITLPDNTNKTYTATDIRDDLDIPNDPSDTSGALLQTYLVFPKSKFSDNIINTTFNMVSVTDCAVSCGQENTFVCESFDYSFTTGTCRLTSIHPNELKTPMSTVLNVSSNTNVYSKLYTMDYTRNSAEVFTTAADKRLPNVNSNEMCARACTTNPDFRCESFEICDDGYCNLRKTHMIQAKPSDLTNATGCTHYSRNHLYDYVERDYKTLNSFGDSSSSSHSVPVESAQECANLCSVGELLPSCASFVTCGIDRGSIECTVTTADPTVSKDIGIISDEHCNLYTRVNTLPIVQPVNPITTRTRRTIVGFTGENFPANPTLRASPTDSQKVYGQKCSETNRSNNTGVRVGLAFGTLLLGLIVGGLSTFIVMKFKFRRNIPEDSQILTPLGD